MNWSSPTGCSAISAAVSIVRVCQESPNQTLWSAPFVVHSERSAVGTAKPSFFSSAAIASAPSGFLNSNR